MLQMVSMEMETTELNTKMPVELRPRFQQERRPGILPVHLGTDPAPLELLPRICDKSRCRVRYVELPFPYLVANHEMPLVPVQYAG